MLYISPTEVIHARENFRNITISYISQAIKPHSGIFVNHPKGSVRAVAQPCMRRICLHLHYTSEVGERAVRKDIFHDVTKVMDRHLRKNLGICNVEELCYTAQEFVNEGAVGALAHQQCSFYCSIQDKIE
jgi:hypothetical protein